MFNRTIDRLLHEIRRLIGRDLMRTRLHHVRTICIDDCQIIMKSRYRFSRIAIPLGNLYLRLERNQVEVLSERAWQQWEIAVAIATNRGHQPSNLFNSTKEFRGVIYRMHPGKSLAEILADKSYSLDDKFMAIRWALDSLSELHRHQADWGDGHLRPISHGDATVNNVIVCFPSKSAIWIDFDTRHFPVLPDVDRQADDLRAFLFSTAACLRSSCVNRLATEFIASNPDRHVLDRLRERLSGNWSRMNTFQLAQAPLSWANSQLLTRTLQQTLLTMDLFRMMQSEQTSTNTSFCGQLR